MRNHEELVARLAGCLGNLTQLQLNEVERLISRFAIFSGGARALKESGDKSPHSKRWPHAPLHSLTGKGTYIVTAGTLNKALLFCNSRSLDLLESQLLSKAEEYRWQLEAWAVFSNHYHFVGHALEDAKTLKAYLTDLHADTAREVNRRNGTSGRQVWYNYWDTQLTYEKSYLARLNYVHQNPVKHGLVPVANQYRWCSAAWFERTATPAQIKTIYSFPTDKVRVVDDFDAGSVE